MRKWKRALKHMLCKEVTFRDTSKDEGWFLGKPTELEDETFISSPAPQYPERGEIEFELNSWWSLN